MKIRTPVLGLVALGVATWHAEAAHAQAGSQDIQIYAGYVFGDRLTQSGLSAQRPRLDDNGAFGARGNAGLGAKYYLTNTLFIDFDARDRYLSKLVSNYGQGLNTAEASFSVG